MLLFELLIKFRVHGLDFPFEYCVLVLHVPLKFLQDVKAFVIPHLLGDVYGSQSVAISDYVELHAAETAQQTHALHGVVRGSHMQGSVPVAHHMVDVAFTGDQ